MVTANERKLIRALVWLKAFRLYVGMRCVRVDANRGFHWLLRLIKQRQVVDDLHHAPACPANHWHRQLLVLQHCNCGAAKHAAAALSE